MNSPKGWLYFLPFGAVISASIVLAVVGYMVLEKVTLVVLKQLLDIVSLDESRATSLRSWVIRGMIVGDRKKDIVSSAPHDKCTQSHHLPMLRSKSSSS